MARDILCNTRKWKLLVFVTVYGKTGHNAACVNIDKRSIDFKKMYCFKQTEGNGLVDYSGNDLSYDDKTWRAQYLDANNSVSAKNNLPRCARFSCRRSHISCHKRFGDHFRTNYSNLAHKNKTGKNWEHLMRRKLNKIKKQHKNGCVLK